jgi:hypothetical protein
MRMEISMSTHTHTHSNRLSRTHVGVLKCEKMFALKKKTNKRSRMILAWGKFRVNSCLQDAKIIHLRDVNLKIDWKCGNLFDERMLRTASVIYFWKN